MSKHLSFIFIFISLLLLSFNSLGQRAVIDSLQVELDRNLDPEKKVQILTALSLQYRAVNSDTAYAYVQSAYKLSKLHEIDTYMGEVHALLGDFLVMHDSLDAAIIEYEKALSFPDVEEDAKNKALILMVLGNIYLVKDDYFNGKYYYLESLDIANKHSFTTIQASLSNNLGIISQYIDRSSEALSYYENAIDIYIQLGDSLQAALIYSNVGDVYSNLDEYELALDYYHKALDINIPSERNFMIASTYLNIGQIQFKKGNIENARNKLLLSRNFIEKPDPSYLGPKTNVLSSIHYNLGLIELKEGNLQKAKENFQITYQLGIENQQWQIMLDAVDRLTEIYEQSGNADSALKYAKLSREYSESLNTDQNIHKLTLLEMEYEFDKKLAQKDLEEQELLAKQKRSQFIYIIVIGGLLLSTIILILLIRLSRLKVKRVKVENDSLQKELDFRNKELTTNVMYLVKKNEMIMSISEKLKELKAEKSPENEMIINDLIRELQSGATDDSWKDFEVRFQQVHTGFYKALSRKFPDLTANELRLSAFLRLNMSTKDISAITYQTVNSIDVARYRLRQKFNLTKDDNLVAYLSQF